MLEDLLKAVKDRFNEEKSKPEKSESNPSPVEIPKDLLFKCPRCQSTMFMEEFVKNLRVCGHCNYHARLRWKERLELICDKDSFAEINKGLHSENPIDFPGYEEKIIQFQEQNDMEEAVVTGLGKIHDYPTVIGIMDSHFMMASMGSVVGEKITRAFEYATENQLPVILFTASGGARMQEGIISLMQMAKTSGAIAKHSEAGQLYITVLTDPTTGGVTASFASLGDIIIAEPRALVGFAGRRVIQDTIKQQLPDEFQSAESLLEHGFVDMICDRKKMRSSLSRIMRMHHYVRARDKEEKPCQN